VLKDSEKRAAYDQLGSRWNEGQEFRPPPDWNFQADDNADAAAFSDFFESLFGGARDARGARHSSFRARGGDRQARIEVSLEEAFSGTTRTLSLEQIAHDDTGRPQRKTRQLNVRIPAGVTDGQQIRLTEQGEPGIGGGPTGDLFLRVQLQPHRLFRTQGKDIVLDLPVTPWEVALGETIRVPTLAGKVDLRIPKGTQSGAQLRLKGKGLPGKPPGDQHVIVRIVTPPAETPEHEAMYRRMAETLPMRPRKAMEDL
jgi:curved DNA-binding protein